MLSLAPAVSFGFRQTNRRQKSADLNWECGGGRASTFFEFFCEGSRVFLAKGRAATESWSSDASPSDSSSSFRSASNSRYLRKPGRRDREQMLKRRDGQQRGPEGGPGPGAGAGAGDEGPQAAAAAAAAAGAGAVARVCLPVPAVRDGKALGLAPDLDDIHGELARHVLVRRLNLHSPPTQQPALSCHRKIKEQASERVRGFGCCTCPS